MLRKDAQQCNLFYQMLLTKRKLCTLDNVKLSLVSIISKTCVFYGKVKKFYRFQGVKNTLNSGFEEESGYKW